MKCPRDGSELQAKIYEANIEIEKCHICDGVFLDAGKLELIQETHEHDYSEQLSQMPNLIGMAYHLAHEKNLEAVACPNCGGECERREYAYCSQVMIDKCLSCHGIWLDHGELEALEIFFERSHMDTNDMRNVFWRTLYRMIGHLPA